MNQITEVATVVRPFSSTTWLDNQRISTPMSRFKRFGGTRAGWRGPGADVVNVMVTDDSGAYGLGQSRGGAVTAALIREHLAGLVKGQDGSDIETRTAEMSLAVLPYADGAIGSMGVGAVELALWDLAARREGISLGQFLGGVHETMSYLTCASPDMIASVVSPHDDRVVKIPMPYGPADGGESLEENLRLVRAVREQLGPTRGLAVDCFMSWDYDYAARFVSAAADTGLAWIEEPLPMADLEGYRRLAAEIAPIPLAAGEHVYGLEAGRRFLAESGVEIAQFDVTWCGGLAVARELGRLIQASGAIFAPHAAATQPWAMHLLTTFQAPTLAEIPVGVAGAEPSLPALTGPGIGWSPSHLGF